MKLSQLMTENNGEPYFPANGMNGYSGEPDGSHSVLFGFIFASKKEADEVFPSGLPDGFDVNWTRFHRPAVYENKGYWEVCVGYWSSFVPEPESLRMFIDIFSRRGKMLKTF